MRRDTPRADVAVLLRRGGTYRAIEEQLGVSRHVISATRRTYEIPLPKGPGYRISPEQREVLEQRVIELTKARASYAEIRKELGISAPTILRIRRNAGIPASGRRHTPPSRTVAQALALYTEPYGDGHTRWTGPKRGRMPQLFAEGGRFNGRHVAFEAHHGRRPVGYVRSSCSEVHCMTGGHLTDLLIRDAAPIPARDSA